MKFIAILLVAVAMPVHAAVSLMLTDNDATPQSTVVQAGGNFDVLVKLEIGPETVTGVDYFLNVPGSDKFKVVGRDITGSVFSDLTKDDTTALTTITGLSGADLGATLQDVSQGVKAGEYLLAKLTIATSPDIAPGNYVLQTTSWDGTGWVGPAPFFNEASYDSAGTFNVFVSPSPEPASLLPLALMLFVGRRLGRYKITGV